MYRYEAPQPEKTVIMFLYVLTLSDGSKQEVIARNRKQAFDCAKGKVVGYTCMSGFE